MEKTTRSVAMAALLGTMALGIGTAHAGLGRSNGSLAIYRWSDGAGWAGGTLLTVRRSADAYSYIGCRSERYTNTDGSHSFYTYCSAYDGSRSASCWTYDEQLQGIATAIDENTYVSFGWKTSGECGWIRVDHSSMDARP